jgi:hypothetical protein
MPVRELNDGQLITATHAEANVFNQAAWADTAMLHDDRDLCIACGQNGDVKSIAKPLGIKKLTVVTPTDSNVTVIDSSINSTPQMPSPVDLIIETIEAGQ